MAAAAEDDKFVLGKGGERRMKGRTITIPVVTGTCAFYLGKKVGGAGRGRGGRLHLGGPLPRGSSAPPPACRCRRHACCCRSPTPSLPHPLLPLAQASEYQSHRWTIYMRSPTGEDLQHVLKKVTFGLHESFTVPKRDIEFPPYELTEVGWGEFDIVVTLHFHVSCWLLLGAAAGGFGVLGWAGRAGEAWGGWQVGTGGLRRQAIFPPDHPVVFSAAACACLPAAG